jgi:hypothetical protein
LSPRAGIPFATFFFGEGATGEGCFAPWIIMAG